MPHAQNCSTPVSNQFHSGIDNTPSHSPRSCSWGSYIAIHAPRAVTLTPGQSTEHMGVQIGPKTQFTHLASRLNDSASNYLTPVLNRHRSEAQNLPDPTHRIFDAILQGSVAFGQQQNVHMQMVHPTNAAASNHRSAAAQATSKARAHSTPLNRNRSEINLTSAPPGVQHNSSAARAVANDTKVSKSSNLAFSGCFQAMEAVYPPQCTQGTIVHPLAASALPGRTSRPVLKISLFWNSQTLGGIGDFP